MNWLSALILVPLLAMVAVLCLPATKTTAVKWVANLAQLLCCLIALPLWIALVRNKPGYQFVETANWIPSIGANYLLGVDGISLLYVLLTALLGLLATLASWHAIQDRVHLFYATLLLLQAGLFGVFLTYDLLLFFVFFEVTLVPMYFLIGIWGGSNRQYAAIKFFLYTLVGSIILLLGIIGVYIYAGRQSFDLTELSKAAIPVSVQPWLLAAFLIGFAVKVPMFPLHTWLPDAHTEAPTAGSVLLAGVLLKMGTYGMVRFALPLFPNAIQNSGLLFWAGGLSLVAIFYGALVCLAQSDWKRLIAYSSVSHLGFCTLGIFSLNANGVTGSLLQGFNHGISTALLFLLVGMVYDRRHTREIAQFGGLAGIMPKFAAVFAIAVFSSAGLPLLNGFIGEFTILQGAFQAHRAWAGFGVFGIVFGAAYLLWLFQQTMLGPVKHEVNRTLNDLTKREMLVVTPLLLLIFWVGLFPEPWLKLLDQPVAEIMTKLEAAR